MTQQMCEEGNALAVPLEDDVWVRGVVARVRGPILFAYFFGPRTTFPTLEDFVGLQAGAADLVGFCGDLGVLQGSWKVVGLLPQFVRDRWPFVPLTGSDRLRGGVVRSYYSEESFTRSIRTELLGADELDRSRPDGVMGSGFVEIRLRQLLGVT